MATEIQELEQTALSWPEKAEAVWIVNQASYEAAAGMKSVLVELRRKIVEHHAKGKKLAFDAHKEAVAMEKRALDPVTEAEGILNRSLKTWENDQEQIRLAAERKLREEAAAAERKTREEAARIEREAREAARKAEEERLLKAALLAERAGAAPEVIDAIISTPIPEPVFVPRPEPPRMRAPVVAPTYTKVSGAAPREKFYHAEVVDIVALCRAVGDGSAPPECVEGNMAYLNRRARTEKDKLAITGVVAKQEEW